MFHLPPLPANLHHPHPHHSPFLNTTHPAKSPTNLLHSLLPSHQLSPNILQRLHLCHIVLKCRLSCIREQHHRGSDASRAWMDEGVKGMGCSADHFYFLRWESTSTDSSIFCRSSRREFSPWWLIFFGGGVTIVGLVVGITSSSTSVPIIRINTRMTR